MVDEPTTNEAGFDQGSLGSERKIYIGKWISFCYVVIDVLFNFVL